MGKCSPDDHVHLHDSRLQGQLYTWMVAPVQLLMLLMHLLLCMPLHVASSTHGCLLGHSICCNRLAAMLTHVSPDC